MGLDFPIKDFFAAGCFFLGVSQTKEMNRALILVLDLAVKRFAISVGFINRKNKSGAWQMLFFQGAQLHLQRLLKGVVYIETSTYLVSLQIFEGIKTKPYP